MSHFTVMVIGDNPETQLQPYHEYECTGIKDEYVVNVDKTPEVKEWLKEKIFVGEKKETGEIDYEVREDRAKENLKMGYKKMTRTKYFKQQGLDVDKEINDYFGYDKVGETYFRFTNPNSKWDWYQLGGRWSDFLKLKHGGVGYDGEPSLLMKDFRRTSGRADAALKKHIDIKGMRDEAGKKAGEEYDKAMKIIEGTPENEAWETLRKRFTKDDTDYSRMDEARAAYDEQPRVQVWNNSDVVKEEFGFFSSPEDFNMTREQYVTNARNKAVSTFALVKDSKWYEKGEMGWFGMASNEKEQNDWDTEVAKLLDEVSDDTLISIYDCHI
jgi:hypothetical protein